MKFSGNVDNGTRSDDSISVVIRITVSSRDFLKDLFLKCTRAMLEMLGFVVEVCAVLFF